MKRKGQCARPLFAERANQVPQKVKHLITVREFVPIDLITKQIASEKIWLIKLRSEQRKRNEFDGQKNMPIPVIDKNRIFRIGPWQWEYGHLHSVPDGPWFRTFISRWCDFAVHVQIEIRRRPRGFFAFFLLHILNTDERASAWSLNFDVRTKRQTPRKITYSPKFFSRPKHINLVFGPMLWLQTNGKTVIVGFWLLSISLPLVRAQSSKE